MEPPIFFNGESGPTVAFYPLVDDAMTTITNELMVQGSVENNLWHIRLTRADVGQLAAFLQAWLARTEGL